MEMSDINVELVYMIRIILASVCGGLIGLEREFRYKGAGVRTHLIVSMSAALMTVLSKYGFSDVVGGGVNVDASRVAAGVVCAIGFLGAGVIFFRRDIVSGVTTAAGLWGTVGIGMAIGAGWYFTGTATTLLILFFQMLLHHKSVLVRTQKTGVIIFRMSEDRVEETVDRRLARIVERTSEMRLRRLEDGQVEVYCETVFSAGCRPEDLVRILTEMPEIYSVELHRP